jgi:hypothetical protein
MADTTRRTFLRGAGLTAAAAAAATVVGPTTAALASAGSGETDDAPDASTERLVAYVSDARTGRISVLAGDRETVVTDRALAQQLARLAD